RCREAHRVPHRLGELRPCQRDDGAVFQPALSGARGRRRRLASPRRADRGGRDHRPSGLRRAGRRVRRVSTRTAGKKASRTTAAKLAALDLRREFDLVLHLPLRYEDETRITPIAEAAPGEPVQVEGTVKSTKIVYRPKRQLLSHITDATGDLVLRFFNFYPSQAKA